MNAAVPIPRQPGFRSVGDNRVRLFGLTAGERAGRFAAKAGIASTGAGDGPAVIANLDYACDPAWFAEVRDRPGHVLTLGGAPVLAHALNAEAASAIEAAMRGGDLELPPGHVAWPAEAAGGLHSAALRKKEAPFVLRLTPDNAEAAERASYDGAYKGVTDVLTLYLWRRPAFYLTRWSAQAGLSPNFITAVGAVLCAAAFWLFWIGEYWPGIAAGFVFMVLDTVDGKLARCTGTSSKWGNVFDHGIDLIHPPFWWWAWLHGLDAYGTPLASDTANMALAVIVGGYVLQRVIEGVFMRRFGMHIHVWQQIDSQFRLITARRNPNMVILVAAMLVARPDIGILAVAAWTVLSLIFHAVRMVQAEVVNARTGKVVSWLG
ncbi:MAG TPA: CDP-alcohol phosphatidyltransferase family protein [Sphingomonadaceae bacterium]|nr:CDP-alcohol phosphatidyltransferase family protein [Sphingomonadaceae bacterium]